MTLSTRRFWSVEEKRAIVAEAEEPDATVSMVARGPGVSEFVVIVVFIGVRLCLIELCQTVRLKQGAVQTKRRDRRNNMGFTPDQAIASANPRSLRSIRSEVSS